MELEDLDIRSRSLILYNHVWASQLGAEEKARFAERDVYRPILEHKNYSPRLVSLSLELYARERNTSTLTAPQIMLKNLANPQELWSHAITMDLSDEARGVLDVFATLGAQVRLFRLRDIWTDALDVGHEVTSEDRFERHMAVLEGDFLSVGGAPSNPLISTANPSIDDFMATRLRGRPRMLGGLLERTPSFSHVEGIQRLFSYRLNFRAADAATPAWQDFVQPKVFDAYCRLLAQVDPLAEEGSIDQPERFRRLAQLWSVVSTEAQALAAVEPTKVLVMDVENGEDFLSWDYFGDVAELLGQLERFEEVQSLHERLLQQLLDLLTESSFSWDEARSALSHAQGLSKPQSRALAEQLEEALDYMVRGELETWRDLDDPPNGQIINDFESMIEYASLTSDPERFYPGYDRAVHFLAMVADQREQETDDLWRGTANPSHDFDVDRLMTGLK